MVSSEGNMQNHEETDMTDANESGPVNNPQDAIISLRITLDESEFAEFVETVHNYKQGDELELNLRWAKGRILGEGAKNNTQ